MQDTTQRFVVEGVMWERTRVWLNAEGLWTLDRSEARRYRVRALAKRAAARVSRCMKARVAETRCWRVG